MKAKNVYDFKKWVFKEKINNFIFEFAKREYGFRLIKENSLKFIKVEKETIFIILKKIAKSIIYLLTLILISKLISNVSLLFKWTSFLANYENFDHGIFINFLISSVSIAGFLVALFYSNLSGIFASRYAHISSRISKELLNEFTNRKYVDAIQNYIILIFLILLLNIIGNKSDIYLAILVIILTIRIVIIFFELSKRVFIYSDIVMISYTSFEKITGYINKIQVGNYKYNNPNFQNHHSKQAIESIHTIDDLSNSLISDNDNEGLVKLLHLNLDLISNYSTVKNKIPHDSLWFPNTYKRKVWFKESYHEVIAAINTGTSLSPNILKDYYFFEDRLFEINIKILKYFIKEAQLNYIYSYFEAYHNLFLNFSKNGDYNYWQISVDNHTDLILKNVDFLKTNTNDIAKGILDFISLFQIDIILGFSNGFVEAHKVLINSKLRDINIEHVLNFNFKFMNNEEFMKFVIKLENERYVEGKMITSQEYIQEYIFFMLTNEICGFLDNVPEILNKLNSFSKQMLNAKLYVESAIISSRIIEVNNKVLNQLLKIEILNEKILKFKNHNFAYHEIDFKEIRNKAKTYYLEAVDQFCKTTIQLYFLKYNIKQDQSDFLGQIYFQLTFLMLELIFDDDFASFEKLYPSFASVCSISGNYIKDIVPPNLNPIYVIDKYTMTAINFMNISGFSMYFSHLSGNEKWEKIVFDYLEKLPIEDKSKFISYCKKCAEIYNENSFNTSLFNTNIKSVISKFIRDNYVDKHDNLASNNLEIDRSDDVVLKKFKFNNHGFQNEIFEIYLVFCLNEFLEDKYLTKYKWAERKN